MKLSTSFVLFVLGTNSLANAIKRTPTTNRNGKCKDVDLFIDALARNVQLPTYPNSTAPGVMYRYLGSLNVSSLPQKVVEGTFRISATYCQPTVQVKGREGTIQVLLHGLSATKEYWNGYDDAGANFPGQYSWVSHAQSQGYATLAIDNLGNGQSDHPDPLEVVQTPLQLSILKSIIQRLRDGSLPLPDKYEEVILASHSYGSILARLLAQFFPTNGADAYILTATSNIIKGLNAFIAATHARSASAVDPSKYGHLAPGYVAVSPSSIRDVLFPLDGDFDPKMLEVEQEEPHIFAVGEIAASRPAFPSNFTGPVMLLTGRQDQIVCGNGNITSLVPDCGVGSESAIDGTRILFPKAKRFDAYVPDHTAHQLNGGYSAGETFGAVNAWLQSVGF